MYKSLKIIILFTGTLYCTLNEMLGVKSFLWAKCSGAKSVMYPFSIALFNCNKRKQSTIFKSETAFVKVLLNKSNFKNLTLFVYYFILCKLTEISISPIFSLLCSFIFIKENPQININKSIHICRYKHLRNYILILYMDGIWIDTY